MALIRWISLTLVSCALFSLSAVHTRAQGQWVPTSGEITASILFRVDAWNKCNGANADTSWIGGASTAGVLVRTVAGSTTYGSQADTFWTNCYDPQSGYRLSVSFVLDTTAKLIRSLSIDTSNESLRSSGETALFYSALPYSLLNDTTIVAHEEGATCLHKLSVTRFRITNTSPCAGGTYGTTATYADLFTDTSVFSCTLRLAFKPTLSGVPGSEPIHREFRAYAALDDQRVRFDFPATAAPCVLAVYDLLGRRINLEKISVGITGSDIPAMQLPPGTYFARLGEMTTSFVVP